MTDIWSLLGILLAIALGLADLANLQLWVRLPPPHGDWQHVDLKALFA